MNSPRFAGTFVISLLIPLSAAAEPPVCYRVFDGSTLCAWSRTWHAPTALDTPLRQYYISRLPGRCDRPDYAGVDACADACEGSIGQSSCATATSYGTYWPASPQVCGACDPVRFERLGQIPNDLELSATGSVAQPSR